MVSCRFLPAQKIYRDITVCLYNNNCSILPLSQFVLKDSEVSIIITMIFVALSAVACPSYPGVPGFLG